MTKRAKLLQGVTKKVNQVKTENNQLVEQYRIIREDLLKLKEDLSKGYGMAREMMDKKTIMKELMKIK